MKKLWRRSIVFLEENELRIVTIIGFIAIASLSFFMGTLHGQKWQQEPLVITQAQSPPQLVIDTTTGSGGGEVAGVAQDIDKPTAQTPSDATGDQDCMYVGSKNSNKYYPPTCSFAKRVKPENLRCFTSDEDAIKKGYVRSKGC